MSNNDEKYLARERSVRAMSNPDWRRHDGDSRWHLGNDEGGSFVARCSGRWPIGDLCELAELPPFLQRCSVCERSRVSVIRIEQGLAELERNAPAHYEWPGVYELNDELFDLGGES